MPGGKSLIWPKSLAAGGLDIKMLPRTAQLEGSSKTGPPPEQEIPLDIPKRTAVYVEQVLLLMKLPTCFNAEAR